MPPSDPFLELVQRTIQEHAMLAAGDTVLAAVSGGPDSVALLLALRALGYSVEIAHFDHQTRDGESRADAAFVRDLAERLGLPFHYETQPVERDAAETPLSFEQYARGVRYAFLRRVARAQGCAALATGHHADDVVETVLMRFLRGAGPAGLAGIPPVRAEEGLRIIRPLWACSRDAVETWLRGQGVRWSEDRTNLDMRYQRNRIRHELIPELSAVYNPRLREALLRLADAQRCENGLLDTLAEEALAACLAGDKGLDRAAFSALHEALQRRCLLLFAWRHGVELPFEQVVEAAAFVREGGTGQRFSFGRALCLHNGRTQTELVENVQRIDPEAAKAVRLDIPGTTKALGRRFTARFLDAAPESLEDYCSPERQVFDAERMGMEIVVRSRRPGDRFAPLGMKGSKKLKDYFIDIGLPGPRRDAQPLVVVGGRIAWVVGYAAGAATAVGPETRRWLEIEVRADPEEAM